MWPKFSFGTASSEDAYSWRIRCISSCVPRQARMNTSQLKGTLSSRKYPRDVGSVEERFVSELKNPTKVEGLSEGVIE